MSRLLSLTSRPLITPRSRDADTRLQRESFRLVNLKEGCSSVGLKVPSVSPSWTLDLTCGYLMFFSVPQQICRLIDFSKPFMLHNLGETHADTTRSYFSSWETLIFNTSGLNTSLQPSSNLQPAWFWQLFKNTCVSVFVHKRQIRLYYQHTTPQHALLRLVFCDLQRTRGSDASLNHEQTRSATSAGFKTVSVYRCRHFWTSERLVWNVSCSRLAFLAFLNLAAFF